MPAVTDPHHDYCTKCGEGSDLISCKTCPRSWHPWCMVPHFTPCSPPELWFCQVCIERGWNELDYSIPGTINTAHVPSVPFLTPSSGNITNNNDYEENWIHDFTQGAGQDSDSGTSEVSPVGIGKHSIVTQGQIYELNQSNLLEVPQNFRTDVTDAISEFHDAEPGFVQQYDSKNSSTREIRKAQTDIPGARAGIGAKLVPGRPAEELTPKSQTLGPNKSVVTFTNGTGNHTQSRKHGSSALTSESFLLAQHHFYVDNSSSNADHSEKTENQTKEIPPEPIKDKRRHSSTRALPITNEEEYHYKPRRSRYSAFGPNVDEAVSLIVSELESNSALKKVVRDLEAKTASFEQAQKIQEGKNLLAAKLSQDKSTADYATLSTELASALKSLECVRAENTRLRTELDTAAQLASRQDEERTSWKATLRSMLGN
jgi:hypothetical protein